MRTKSLNIVFVHIRFFLLLMKRIVALICNMVLINILMFYLMRIMIQII